MVCQVVESEACFLDHRFVLVAVLGSGYCPYYNKYNAVNFSNSGGHNYKKFSELDLASKVE